MGGHVHVCLRPVLVSFEKTLTNLTTQKHVVRAL
jgi:hypothetical protein